MAGAAAVLISQRNSKLGTGLLVLLVAVGCGCATGTAARRGKSPGLTSACSVGGQTVESAIRAIHQALGVTPADEAGMPGPNSPAGIESALLAKLRVTTDPSELASYLSSAGAMAPEAGCLALRAWAPYFAAANLPQLNRTHTWVARDGIPLADAAVKVAPDSCFVVWLDAELRSPGRAGGRWSDPPEGFQAVIESARKPATAAIVAWRSVATIGPMLPELARIVARHNPEHPLSIALKAASLDPRDPKMVDLYVAALSALGSVRPQVSGDSMLLLAQEVVTASGAAGDFGRAVGIFDQLPEVLRVRLSDGYTAQVRETVASVPFSGEIRDMRLELAAIMLLSGRSEAQAPPAVAGDETDDSLAPYRHLVAGMQTGLSRDELFDIAVDANRFNTGAMAFWGAVLNRALVDAGFRVPGRVSAPADSLTSGDDSILPGLVKAVFQEPGIAGTTGPAAAERYDVEVPVIDVEKGRAIVKVSKSQAGFLYVAEMRDGTWHFRQVQMILA